MKAQVTFTDRESQMSCVVECEDPKDFPDKGAEKIRELTKNILATDAEVWVLFGQTESQMRQL